MDTHSTNGYSDRGFTLLAGTAPSEVAPRVVGADAVDLAGLPRHRLDDQDDARLGRGVQDPEVLVAAPRLDALGNIVQLVVEQRRDVGAVQRDRVDVLAVLVEHPPVHL